MEEDRDKELVAARRRQEHARKVRKQVEEKEAERVAARKAFFEEGIKLDQGARER